MIVLTKFNFSSGTLSMFTAYDYVHCYHTTIYCSCSCLQQIYIFKLLVCYFIQYPHNSY